MGHCALWVSRPGMALSSNGDSLAVGTNDAPLGPARNSRCPFLASAGWAILPAPFPSTSSSRRWVTTRPASARVHRDGQIYVGWASGDDGSAQGTGGLQVLQNLSDGEHGRDELDDGAGWKRQGQLQQRRDYELGEPLFLRSARSTKAWCVSSTLSGWATHARAGSSSDSASALGDRARERSSPCGAACSWLPSAIRCPSLIARCLSCSRMTGFPEAASQPQRGPGCARGWAWPHLGRFRQWGAPVHRKRLELFTDTVGALPPA